MEWVNGFTWGAAIGIATGGGLIYWLQQRRIRRLRDDWRSANQLLGEERRRTTLGHRL